MKLLTAYCRKPACFLGLSRIDCGNSTGSGCAGWDLAELAGAADAARTRVAISRMGESESLALASASRISGAPHAARNPGNAPRPAGPAADSLPADSALSNKNLGPQACAWSPNFLFGGGTATIKLAGRNLYISMGYGFLNWFVDERYPR